MSITLVVIARIPAAGVERFQHYESLVLAFLADHAGRLERRLRNGDGTVEVHVVTFPSRRHVGAYRNDARRRQHQALLAASGAEVELIEVREAP